MEKTTTGPGITKSSRKENGNQYPRYMQTVPYIIRGGLRTENVWTVCFSGFQRLALRVVSVGARPGIKAAILAKFGRWVPE